MSATILENTDFDSVQNSGRLLIGNSTFEVEVGVADIFVSSLMDSGYRLRSGDYRILYDITATTVKIFAVGNRKDIYR